MKNLINFTLHQISLLLLGLFLATNHGTADHAPENEGLFLITEDPFTCPSGNIIFVANRKTSVFETGSVTYVYPTLKKAIDNAGTGDCIRLLEGLDNTLDLGTDTLLMSKDIDFIFMLPDILSRTGLSFEPTWEVTVN